jgi:hypothetical protein
MADARSWEKLTNKQVLYVGENWRDHLPSIKARSQSLNLVASHAIIRGLQAYGGTGSELSEGGS